MAVLLAAGACSNGAGKGQAAAPATTTAAPTTTVAAPTSTSTAPQPPAWQARAAAPTSRQEVASTVADGKVWVMGGLTAAGASTKVESYDVATDQWAAGPDLPVAVHHSAATTYRGEIVVAGGFLAAGDLYSRPSDRVFALRNGGWVELPRLARPRGAAAAAAVGNRLVVVGGRDASKLISPTEVFDGTAWHDATAIPSPRDHLAAVSDGRSVFAVGGRRLDPGATSSVLDRYDPAADAWEDLPAMPTARGGIGVALIGNRLVAVGGEDATRTYVEVEAYDLAARTWRALPPSPSPRHGLAVGAVGPTVAALVGGTQAGVAPSAKAEAISPL
jgi:non-specific serine/threonine protein kinase